jgi:hypothetical protein
VVDVGDDGDIANRGVVTLHVCPVTPNWGGELTSWGITRIAGMSV